MVWPSCVLGHDISEITPLFVRTRDTPRMKQNLETPKLASIALVSVGSLLEISSDN